MSDAISCSTHKDLADGAFLEGSPILARRPVRVQNNLTESIVDQEDLNKYRTNNNLKIPLFILDFGMPVTSRFVNHFAQHVSVISIVNTIASIKVREGMAAVNILGNFSS